MTTPGAAQPPARRPILLGIVVPIVYLLALTGAVMLAGTKADARPAVSVPAPRVRAHLGSRLRVAPTSGRRLRGTTARRASRLEPPLAVDSAVTASRSAGERRRVSSAPSRVALVVRVAGVTTPADMQAAIDRCVGPIAIDWTGWGHPREIAEHDYCGGAVFASLATGSEVQVIGGGLSGLYVVDGLRRFVPLGAWASELDGLGDIALQTCVSNGMVLVGLDRIS